MTVMGAKLPPDRNDVRPHMRCTFWAQAVRALLWHPCKMAFVNMDPYVRCADHNATQSSGPNHSSACLITS